MLAASYVIGVAVNGVSFLSIESVLSRNLPEVRWSFICVKSLLQALYTCKQYAIKKHNRFSEVTEEHLIILHG